MQSRLKSSRPDCNSQQWQTEISIARIVQVNRYGAATWVLRKTASMKGMLCSEPASAHIRGYDEDTDAIFMSLYRDPYSNNLIIVQLESMRVRMSWKLFGGLLSSVRKLLYSRYVYTAWICLYFIHVSWNTSTLLSCFYLVILFVWTIKLIVVLVFMW